MKSLLFVLVLFIVSCGQSEERTDSAETGAMAAGQPSGQMAWNAPSGWIKENPSSSMRTAQFSLPKAGSDPEDASVVIFNFGGEGGGVRANLDRWISQFKDSGERKIVEEDKVEVNGLAQTVVRISGTYLFQERPMASTKTEKPGFQMLAAVMETKSGPWFVRFVGPQATVEKWEPSFREFLRSFKMT
jgi:hypothetical protein